MALSKEFYEQVAGCASARELFDLFYDTDIAPPCEIEDQVEAVRRIWAVVDNRYDASGPLDFWLPGGYYGGRSDGLSFRERVDRESETHACFFTPGEVDRELSDRRDG